MLFLLFLTIPVVLSVDPKCPEGFTHFKRVPTAKNNHTKDWCMAIMEFPDMADRDRARSMCIHYKSKLSIPENQEEFDTLSRVAMKENITYPHAIDGEVSAQCWYVVLGDFSVNSLKLKGECNNKNKLFAFDDSNTDPTWLLNKYPYYMPHKYGYNTERGVEMRWAATCLVMESTVTKGNDTIHVGAFESTICKGNKRNKEQKYQEVNSVICGRHPL